MFPSSMVEATRIADPALGCLRLLVVVGAASADPGGPAIAPDREAERLLAATGELERAGRLKIEYLVTPTVAALRLAVTDDVFDAVHLRGTFDRDPATGQAGMVFVDAAGDPCVVPLAPVLAFWQKAGAHPSPRHARPAAAAPLAGAELPPVLGPDLVVLDASAGAAASDAVCEELAADLVTAGIPSVATFASKLPAAAAQIGVRSLYQALCAGASVGSAVSRAREHLEHSGLTQPPMPTVTVICGSSAATLPVLATPASPGARPQPGDPTPARPRLLGRGPLVRELVHGLADGGWRTVVLHGPSGVGKSAMASELARRLEASAAVEAVVTIDCRPTVTADEVLEVLADRLSAFGVPRLDTLIHRPVAYPHKVAALIEALATHRVLVVVDGVERWLTGAAAWPAPDSASAARSPGQQATEIGADELTGGRVQAGTATSHVQIGTASSHVQTSHRIELEDRDLGRLLVALVTAPTSAARWLFTSRVDFEPRDLGDRAWIADSAPSAGEVDAGVDDAPAAISAHVALDGLGFEAAAQWMRHQHGLSNLPVRAVGGAPSLRRVFRLTGGSPWMLAHVAAWAAESSAAEVLEALATSPAPANVDAVLDRSAARLPPRSAELVRTAAVFDEPVPVSALAELAATRVSTTPVAGTADALGLATAQIDHLVAGGWLVTTPDAQSIELAGPVRSWVRRRIARAERVASWRAAAELWLAAGAAGTHLQARLRAWRYLDQAGDAAAADSIVQQIWEALVARGNVSLAVRLLERSVATLSGLTRAMALDRLAQVLLVTGETAYAADVQAEALIEYEAAGDWRLVAAALQRLGRLQQVRGAYDAARRCYQRAMQIAEGMGDRGAAARGLCQLGVLAQVEGRLDQALEHFERALDAAEAAGDRAEAMSILSQLGMVHEIRGENERALDRYEQALATAATFGDAAAMAGTLHQLGLLHERAGAFDRARLCYTRSLALAEKRDDSVGAALSLHQLGLVHTAEGNYERARICFQRSLTIGRQLGAHGGVAGNLYQLGHLDELQGRAAGARVHYVEALAEAQHAGDRLGMVRALGRLGQLCEEDGALDQAVACAVRSMVVLNQMGSPERDVAAGVLVRLRRSMTPEGFDEAFKAALRTAVNPTRRTGQQLDTMWGKGT